LVKVDVPVHSEPTRSLFLYVGKSLSIFLSGRCLLMKYNTPNV